MHSQSLRTGETDSDHLVEIIDEFGIDKNRLENELGHIINNVTINLNSIETSILLLDSFYKHFHMKTSSIEDKLIGPTIYKEKGKIQRPKRLIDLMQAYVDNRININFGLSITEYLGLSIMEIKLLLESAGDINEKKSAAMSEYLDENKELLGEENE